MFQRYRNGAGRSNVIAHKPKGEDMQRYRRILVNLAVVVGVLVVAMVAAAQETVPVTDPAVLTSMGFPADAKNVFTVTGDPVPNDFGQSTHYIEIGGHSFAGREDIAGSWQYDGGDEGCCVNLSRRGTEIFADAELQFPTGVRLDRFRVWVNDANGAADLSWFAFESCHPAFGPGATTITTIANGISTGSAGNQSIVSTVAARTINNRDCHYIFRVRFDATTGLTFQRARAEWVRQVSPAPLVATFTDVPTTNPFYRFVEAMVASGLTGGCGPGLYCPNDPVTRAQMAVFLSAALGLNWP
jgi:hypothetical protein